MAIVSGILSTQLLDAVNANGCDNDDPDTCSSDTVALDSSSSYVDSAGPRRFSNYTFLITGIQILGAILFIPFLPNSKDECKEWKRKGEEMGGSDTRAWICLIGALIIITYGIIATSLLLDPSTSCMT